MKTEAPSPLLPLLRSRAHAEVLTIVLLNPDREWSLTELARLIGTSVATALREVRRAEEAGVVRSRKVGNTRLVSAEKTSILTPPLTQLLLLALGPKTLLAESLRGISGIEGAYIFGSWAARYAGRRGPSPNDIDVLVLGQPDRDALDSAVASAERRLERQINVTIRRTSWWNDGDDSFRKEIGKRPLVELIRVSDEKTSA